MSAAAEVAIAKRRVLFVDDDPDVLGALQNILRRMRASWEMVFVDSGEAALAELARAPFDVVVSDMRMPGMDGAELLARVRDLHPSAARIVLSGYADPGAMMRAFSVAHQFFAKPTSAIALRDVIERACSIRRLLADPAMRDRVGKLDHLPSAPAIYAQLTDLMERPDVNMAAVSRVVEQDPAMSVKILQIVNSPYFGLAQQIVSVQAAVSYLGLHQIRAIALSIQMFAILHASGIDRETADRFQRAAFASARVARRLSADPPQGELAFSAALMHDIGQIILATSFPEEHRALLRESLMKGARPLVALEREKLGVTHAQMGGYLLGLWGLPAAIVDAVAFHQEPVIDSAAYARLTAVVHAAAAWTDGWIDGVPIDETPLDHAFLEKAGIADKLEEWKRVAQEELKKIEQGLR